MYALKEDKNQNEGLRGPELENYLLDLFDGEQVVSKAQFMKVFKIGHSAMKELMAYGRAPQMIVLGVGSGEGRYFLKDIARWVERNRGLAPWPMVNPDGTPRRGRGRPRKDSAILQPVMAVA